MSVEDSEKLTLRQKIEQAIDSGTNAETLAILIREWGKDEARADFETSVREDMGLESKSEPTKSSNWNLESLVRSEMEHPSQSETESLSTNPDIREQQIRQRMNLPAVSQSEGEQ